MGWIGTGEIILILLLALVLFGPKKLPEIGRIIGRGIKEMRKAADFSLDNLVDDDPAKKKDSNKLDEAKNTEKKDNIDNISQKTADDNVDKDLIEPDFDEKKYKSEPPPPP